MNHLHFDTELDLSAEEKTHCFENHVVRLAASHVGAGDAVALGAESARLQKFFLESRDFHVVPVNDAEILKARAARGEAQRRSA